MEDPRPFDEVMTDLIDDTADKVNWNRKWAEKLLDKANEVEENASITASKLREAAASLVIEAQSFADNVSDYLSAEFPLVPTDGEDDDE